MNKLICLATSFLMLLAPSLEAHCRVQCVQQQEVFVATPYAVGVGIPVAASYPVQYAFQPLTVNVTANVNSDEIADKIVQRLTGPAPQQQQPVPNPPPVPNSQQSLPAPPPPKEWTAEQKAQDEKNTAEMMKAYEASIPPPPLEVTPPPSTDDPSWMATLRAQGYERHGDVFSPIGQPPKNAIPSRDLKKWRPSSSLPKSAPAAELGPTGNPAPAPLVGSVFASRCIKCHQTGDEAKHKPSFAGELDCKTKMRMINAVVEERMPKGGKLTADEVGKLIEELSK